MDASEDKGNFFVVHLHLKKVNKKKISVGVCMISEKLFMSACCFHTTHWRCSLTCSELEGSFSAPSPLQNLSMPCWHQADLVLLPRGPGAWARQHYLFIFSSSILRYCWSWCRTPTALSSGRKNQPFSQPAAHWARLEPVADYWGVNIWLYAHCYWCRKLYIKC